MAARGLIIVLPLLIAAGVAVYESPQVRQFLDEHRRKLTVALSDLGEQFGPQPDSSRSSRTRGGGGDSRTMSGSSSSRGDDASTREDASPEAEERRRRFRQEIMERRRVMEQRRGTRNGIGRRGSSFDDLVDVDGNLKNAAAAASSATGTENVELSTLRRRRNEAAGTALGSSFANPFSDEMQIDDSSDGSRSGLSDEDLARQLQMHFDEEYAVSQRDVSRPDDAPLSRQEVQELERIVREAAEREGKELPEPGSNLNMSEAELLESLHQLEAELGPSGASTPVRQTPGTSDVPSTRTVPRTAGSQAASLEAEGVLVEANSTNPSDTPLIDLTPTTSAPGTPRQAARQPVHQQSYQSIQDWAEQSTASFHSLYDSSVGVPAPVAHDDVSELESIAAPSDAGSEMDIISEPGISTPGTWTEVGSVASLDEYGNHQHQQHN